MRTLRIISFLSVFLPAISWGQSTLYWDTNGATPGLAQGSGSWNAAHWSTSASGDIATGNWVDGSVAQFTTDLGSALSIDSAVTVGGISLPGTASLDLSGTGVLTFTPGAVVTQNSNLVLGVTVAGNAAPGQTAFTLAGFYDVYFNKANTFTGKLIVNGGDISADTAQAFGASGAGNETYLTNEGGQFLNFENDMTVNEGFVFGGYRYVGSGNHTVDLAGPIVLDGGGSKGIWSGDYLTISGVISETNGAGTFVPYAKLTGNNTFTGVLQVGGVTIDTFGTTGQANPLGLADTVQLGYYYEGAVGGTLHYAGTAPTTTTDRKFSLFGDTNTIDVMNANSVLVLTGTIANSTEALADASPSLAKKGSGALILRGDNSYSGDTFLNDGILIAGHDRAFGTDVESQLVIGGGDTASGNNPVFLLEDGVTLDKYVHVYNQNYEGATTLGLANTGTATFGEEIYLERDIDVKVNTGGTLNFNEAISDGVSGGGLRKVGGGTAAFHDGIDLRVGGLSIDDGKVILQAPAGVTLVGGLEVHTNGSLSLGSTTGTLTVPSFEISGNVVWKLGDLTTNTLHDRFVVESGEGGENSNGLFIANGASLTVDLSLLGVSTPSNANFALNNTFWQSEQVWTLIAFSGSGVNELAGQYNPLLVTNGTAWAGGTFDTFVGGGQGAWAAFNDGDVFLRFTPVPEPSTWLLMIMAMGALGAALRRRRALSFT